MNGFRIGQFGSTDYGVDIKVAFEALGRADTDTLVGKTDMQGFTVLIPNSLQALIMRRAISPLLAMSTLWNINDSEKGKGIRAKG